jgi:lipid A ethanolaminephosphotransferase
VQACGTDTATSLPCMFAPVGRRDYDGARIRRSESLLHVVARAGVQVHWRDNQSGCKGVCTGLSQDRVIDLNPPGLCEGGRHGHCFDEGLLHGLPERLAKAQGTQLLVLHMLGNHGPAYFRRYPKSFGIFQPACERDDLQRCTPAEIANAYDNALRYTDHVLARLIGMLEASKMDTAMIYVADHGESLGENGLWLHGLPYAIAPEAQKRVPMVMWSSPGFAGRIGLGLDCLGRRMQQPVAHDHLFHSLLGLLQVQTALYEPTLDLSGECRPGRVH